MRRLFWPAVVLGLALAAFDIVPAAYVVALLMALAIWRVGTAMLASLHGGGPTPESPPAPVDTRVERVTYWCEGCGAELLLLVRGSRTPPRHCGEPMHERREVPRDVHG
ncbi:MAG: hypothetical protein KY434_00750 [Actinobacteria bacterium]|nr:hypothetical protein [Actinomycetota bacterium]